MIAEEYIIPINETAKDYDEMFVGVIRRQPVLIRCRECIRWRQSKSNTAAKVCDWDGYEKTENDFCSWAKRREDD